MAVDIVVDSSVIIAVIVNEPTKAALVAHTTGATLLAPSSIHWEIGNAFSAMLKRKRITLTEATSALVAYHEIPLRLVDVDLARALVVADKLDIYAYDAFLITCALDYTSPLLTLDSGLRHAAALAGVTILELTS
jgi:predicted nucleic acid-binding protein